MHFMKKTYTIFRPITARLAFIVFILLSIAFFSPDSAIADDSAATKSARHGILEPLFNAGHVDPGVALDKSKYLFYPSRATTGTENRQLTIDLFDPPEICAKCHIEIYSQWKGSMHSNAWVDPIYLAVMRKASEATNGLTDNLCIGCHTPIGLTTGEATPSGEKLSKISKNGVQCDFCHNVSGAAGVGNAPFVLTPRKFGRPLKFGPFKDAKSPYHDTEYSELHTTSAFCGTCHNVTHPINRVPIERTYDEWKDSPYVAEGIGCQECHMTPGPGYTKNPGQAAVGSKKRDHIFTHYFTGGNTLVPSMLGSEKHSALARETLQGAARIEILSVRNVRPGSIATVGIRVHNSGAGHKLPTGFPEGREIWIDFRVLDDTGKEIYRLGRLDSEGHLEPGSRSFKVVLGDDAGNIIDLEVWKATRILSDNRILPRGYADVTFVFPLPAALKEKIVIKADLCYHSFPQSFVNYLLGDGAPTVPTVIMTSLSEQKEVPGN